MNNLNNITRDWTHADQFLNDKIDKNNDSIKRDFSELTNHVKESIKTLNGDTDSQFVTDSTAKSVKVVPDGVNKGIIAMIGGSSRKTKNLIDITNLSTSALNGSGQTITLSKDGLTFTGTSTATGYTEWQNVVTLPAGSYKFSIAGDVKATVEDEFKFRLKSGTTNITEVSSSQFTEGIQFSLQSTTTLNLAVFTSKVTTITGTAKPMIRLANENPTYEPYGQLWNAPVEKITLTNKNAYYEDTAEHKVIDGSGNIFNDDGTRITDFIPIEIGIKIYTDVAKSSISAYVRVAYYTSDKTFISRTVYNAKEGFSVETPAIPSNAVYMRICPDISIKKLVATFKELVSVPDRKVIPIPSEILNLPDYGLSARNAYNYIDFESMIYHHRVSSVDMGTLSWFYYQNPGHDSMRAILDNIKPQSENISANIITSNYITTTNGSVYTHSSDNIIAVGNTNRLEIYSSTMGTDPDIFKASLNNIILNYELAEEELIDISDLLLPFKCEPGGAIEFVNEHNIDVPNTIIYEKEMK